MAKRTHKDVEFFVEPQTAFDSWDDAVIYQVQRSLVEGEPREIDVVVHSRAGAKWWGGDAAVEQYNEDPDASVFERIAIEAESQGRVP